MSRDRKNSFSEAISPVMSMNDAAWKAGVVAGLANIPTCPYPTGSAKAWSWSSGWGEGKAQRLATVGQL